MGLLDGQIAKAIYAGFKGRLLTGRLLRVSPIAADGTDEDGDAASVTPTLYGLEGFDDVYSDFSRANSGIPDTDVKVCIFAASLPAGVRPLKDDKVALRRAGVDRWYQLRRDATDPAEALWVCQAFELEGPPSELPSL